MTPAVLIAIAVLTAAVLWVGLAAKMVRDDERAKEEADDEQRRRSAKKQEEAGRKGGQGLVLPTQRRPSVPAVQTRRKNPGGGA